MQALIAIAAILAGILIGYWFRNAFAKNEKQQLDQRNTEFAASLIELRAELTHSQALAASRAGFESLCVERERTIQQLTAERESTSAALLAKTNTERELTARISQLEAELGNERKNLTEKVALLESARQSLSDQFQTLAAEILEKKSRTFAETSQKDLGTLLMPLQAQIKEFRDKVEQAQSDSKTGVTRLETLIGALGGLNEQLADEARNLTSALRGSAKTQGDWGEFILRDLLEKAGLREGDQYTFQQSFSKVDENGRSATARTDVIVNIPGGRNLVIDSKVSLNAYTDCVKADCEDDRKAAMKSHLTSVRAHISGLSKAGYSHLPGISTPDFVVMFVPVEPAFLLALQNDSDLWSDAYRQGVLLVGPTTLLYIIRIINVLWDQDKQTRNVKDVMERGAKLYEKFAAFINDMEDLGRSLRGASQSYEEAKKKLGEGPGNLVRQVEMLRELGVKPKFSKKAKPMPLAWLASSGVEEEGLALAAVEANAASDID